MAANSVASSTGTRIEQVCNFTFQISIFFDAEVSKLKLFLGGHGTLVKQPSLASQVPQETMNALINNTAPSSGERKISFVIQDDSESKTSSQTTLVQVRLNVYVISANVFFSVVDVFSPV